MLPKRLEEVSLNAWPALQQMLLDGWLLRFAKGYTRRANSINPLYGSSMDIDEKIDRCETIYVQKGLPVVFRLTPFATPSDLDHNLERRHYERVALTHVQHVDLTHQELPVASAATLQEATERAFATSEASSRSIDDSTPFIAPRTRNRRTSARVSTPSIPVTCQSRVPP